MKRRNVIIKKISATGFEESERNVVYVARITKKTTMTT